MLFSGTFSKACVEKSPNAKLSIASEDILFQRGLDLYTKR